MRVRLLTLTGLMVAIVALTAACGGDGGTTGGGGNDVLADNTGGDQSAGGDVQYGQFAYLPPEMEELSFNVVVNASSTIATVNQPVDLEARIVRGEAAGTVTWSWDQGAAVGKPEGATLTVQFEQPGEHLVAARATDGEGNTAESGVVVVVHPAGGKFLVGDVDGDGAITQDDAKALDDHLSLIAALDSDAFARADVDLDGRLTDFDLELVDLALAQEGDAPTLLWPDHGSLGSRVRMLHPALLDPAAPARITFPGSEPLIPVRGKPGYATFVVPPDQDKPGVTKVELEVGGEQVATFDFEVFNAPAASADPGAKVVESLELLDEVVAYLPAMVDSYMAALDIPEDQKALLGGMLTVALESYAVNRVAFVAAFDKMEPEGRAAFEQVALANGLGDIIGELQGARDDIERTAFWPGLPGALTAGQASMIMTALCAALDIADISGKVAEINEIAAGYLSWFDWWPLKAVPIVGQVIQFLSSISSAIGAITDIIGLVADFLPEFGDLNVLADPSELELGQSAAITVSVVVNLGSKICSAGANLLIDNLVNEMTSRLTNRLGGSIPLVGSAFRAARFNQDNMNKVVSLIYSAISAIAGKIVEALGVKELLQQLADMVCQALQDPNLPVTPSEVTASCGAASTTSWTCTEACAGAVTITGKALVCGDEKQGDDGITCIGCSADNCTGCCDGAADCLAFAQQSDTKCGSGGAQCAPCQQHFTCSQGNCACQSECTTPGETKCVGNDVHICTQVVANPPCNKWLFSAPCINGATCENGECVGGCHGENCDGCCQADGTCLPGTSTDYCGKGGMTCGYCTGQDTCINGECLCEPNCANKQCGPNGCGGSCGDCGATGECNANGQCVSLCGNGKIDPGEQCEKAGDCGLAMSCVSCQCSNFGGECACQDSNAVLDGSKCDWPDGNQCSGWHSVCMENDQNYMGKFPSGTEFCAWGCCITLYCKPGDPAA